MYLRRLYCGLQDVPEIVDSPIRLRNSQVTTEQALLHRVSNMDDVSYTL